MLKKFLIGIVVLFVALQLVRPQQNKAVVVPGTTVYSLGASPEVKNILQKACTDCHSNNTRYPWYHKIQPVAWWLDDHVEEGKHHLNFDLFATYNPKKGAHKMEEIAEQVESGEMPTESYVWLHPEAKLTAAEKKVIIDWANNLKQQLQR